jgi:formylglycine-generating enzyme required for sulfatase activity
MPIDYASKASIGMLKRIPAGVFRMGSSFHPREYPPRLMQVSEFQIAQSPVTVSQYEVFVNSEMVNDKKWWSAEGWDWLNNKADGWGRKKREVPDNWNVQVNRSFHPVVGVTVYEAEAYCAWLGEMKGNSVRLPAEVEWEYAARGDDARAFPWGDEFRATFANTMESERSSTLEASSMIHDSSPFGVMGVCGNVQQWTSSEYTPLKGEVTPPGVLYVARGGSFNDTLFGSRTSYRRAYPPGFFYPYLGFRIVVGVT